MRKVFARSLVVLSLLVGCAQAAQPQLPQSARKVVLEKSEKGYRWKLIDAPVPRPGDHQVLVHVRAVGLNRGDWELLESSNSSLAGRIPATDAAGDVVVVGKGVQHLRPGARVTSLYFRNWTDGPASKEVINGAHGFDVDGVLGEYVVLDETGVVPAPQGLTYEEAPTLPASARGVYVGSRADYLRMSAFIAEHRLHPLIDETFPLEQFDAALEHLRNGNPVGRVVLQL